MKQILPDNPPSLIDDVKVIINYIRTDELRHFQESDEPENHIYHNIARVYDFLNQN